MVPGADDLELPVSSMSGMGWRRPSHKDPLRIGGRRWWPGGALEESGAWDTDVELTTASEVQR